MNKVLEQLIPLADAHAAADEYVAGTYGEVGGTRACSKGGVMPTKEQFDALLEDLRAEDPHAYLSVMEHIAAVEAERDAMRGQVVALREALHEYVANDSCSCAGTPDHPCARCLVTISEGQRVLADTASASHGRDGL